MKRGEIRVFNSGGIFAAEKDVNRVNFICDIHGNTALRVKGKLKSSYKDSWRGVKNILTSV